MKKNIERVAYDLSDAKYLFNINSREIVECRHKIYDEFHRTEQIIFYATSYKKAIEFFTKIS